MAESGYTIGMEGRQIRAARALLGLSQQELCDLAGITRPTLKALESETGDPKRSSTSAVEDVFKKQGIIFMEDDKIVGVLISKAAKHGH